MSEKTYIPDDNEVVGGGTGKSWRFSKGKIVSGREKDGTLVDRPHIRGTLLRVGIHEGVTNDQYAKPYKQVEADIETRDGVIYVKAGLLDGETFELRPSRSSIDFAWGLMQLVEGDVFQITTAKGEDWEDDKGRNREGSTYVNFAKLIPTQKDDKTIYKEERLYRPKVDKDAPKVPMVDQWGALEPQVQSHPLFADRPASHSDDDDGNATTHLSALVKECAAKAWPSPEQAPGEWLAIVAALLGQQPKSSIAQVSDDEWGQIRLGFQARTEKFAAEGKSETVPALLQPAVERLKPVVAAGVLD